MTKAEAAQRPQLSFLRPSIHNLPESVAVFELPGKMPTAPVTSETSKPVKRSTFKTSTLLEKDRWKILRITIDQKRKITQMSMALGISEPSKNISKRGEASDRITELSNMIDLRRKKGRV